MDFSTYSQAVKEHYDTFEFLPQLNAEKLTLQKQVSRMFATMLRDFIYLAHAPNANADILSQYSQQCSRLSDFASGMAQGGFRDGVFSYNLLAADHVTDDAIQLAQSRPPKHYGFIEVPVLADLTNHKLYYYQKTPLWGAAYYKHIRKHIQQNFSFLPDFLQ